MGKRIQVTDNDVLINIMNLMESKGVRQVDLANYLGLSRNAITQWKMNVSKSYMNYLDELSIYFGVTRDELLRPNINNDTEFHVTREEQSIIEDYRLLPRNRKLLIAQLLSFLKPSDN